MKFTESHEWVNYDGEVVCVGITNHAQKELGDIVYVELPEVGTEVTAGMEVAVLESTKAAADVYTPVSGTVTAVNAILDQSPELVNSGAEGDGWLVRIQPSNPAELDALLDLDAYQALLA